MQYNNQFHYDTEFTYRGHLVKVSHKSVPAEYQGVNDMMFTVMVDNRTIVVPGIWNAYKQASSKGIKLLLMALLDGQPAVAEMMSDTER